MTIRVVPLRTRAAVVPLAAVVPCAKLASPCSETYSSAAVAFESSMRVAYELAADWGT
jgi:hypothetical protein